MNFTKSISARAIVYQIMRKTPVLLLCLLMLTVSLAGCTSEDLAEINDAITDESKDCYVVMSSTNAMIKYPAEYAHMADDGYNQTMTYDEQCRLSSTFKVTNWFESYQNMTYSDDGHLVKVESYSSHDNWANSSYNYDVYVYENGLLCLLYTSPSPRDATLSRMPSSA